MSKIQDDISSQETLKTRHHIRLEFWNNFLKEVNTKSQLLKNISPSKDRWIGFGIGISGISINLVIAKLYVRAEIYFNRGSQKKNKDAFDYIKGLESESPETYRVLLIWERLDEKISCRIKHQLNGVSVYERDDWSQMIEFLVNCSIQMEANFRPLFKKTKDYLKGL